MTAPISNSDDDLTFELMTKHFTDQLKTLTILDYNGVEQPLLPFLKGYISQTKTNTINACIEALGSDEYHAGENHWEISETEEARNELRAEIKTTLTSMKEGEDA